MNTFSQEIQPITPNLPSITEAKAIEILNSMPSFDNLSEEARNQILKIAAADEYKRSLQHKAKIARLNYEDIKATFLNNTKSSHTKEAYSLALRRLEMYLSFQGKSFAEVSTLDADKLIQSDFLTKPLIKDTLNTSAPTRAAASIRRDSSCLGAFYAFVQRISNNEFGNPFRGTRAKPKLKPQKRNLRSLQGRGRNNPLLQGYSKAIEGRYRNNGIQRHPCRRLADIDHRLYNK